MMLQMRTRTGSAGLALAIGFTLLPSLSESQTLPAMTEVNRYVESELTRQGIPGAFVGALRNGEVLHARGYGMANLEHQVPVDEYTLFQSGSIGKQFTAAAVLLLVEDGKIDLDAPVSTYLPEVPASWSEITVRHMLSHTSGIADFVQDMDLRKDYTDEERVTLAIAAEPVSAPGERFEYSNSAYQLLGVIVTRLAGKHYGDFLNERLFELYGMKTARIISERDIVPDRSDGYEMENGEVKNQRWVAPAHLTSADGSLYFSLLDMIAWEKVLVGSDFLTPESRREWWSPTLLNSGEYSPYGFGWSVEHYRGHPNISHGGAWQGFRSYITRFTVSGLTVFVFANIGVADAGVIAHGVAGIIDPAVTPVQRLPVADTDPSFVEQLQAALRDYLAGKDDVRLVPGLSADSLLPRVRDRIESVAARRDELLFVGCDDLSHLAQRRHGQEIARQCHLRTPEDERGGVLTFELTAAAKVGAIEVSTY